MNRLTLLGFVLGFAALGTTACSGDPAQVEPVAASVEQTTTAREVPPGIKSSGKHQPSEAAVSLYTRRLNEILAETGESMTLAQAMPLAASVCQFIDGGNSPYDAVQVLEKSGIPEDSAMEIVPLAVGAACTQHLPG